MVKCLECQKEFPNDGSLHKHLRAHKLSVAFYYQKNFPRYDKLDNSLIKFKSKEFYFNNEFNSRTNFAKWLKSAPPDEQKNYVTSFLTNRKEKKGLVYSLTQNELKTLPCPGIGFLNGLFGDYYKFCEGLGFKNKFVKYSLEGDLKLHPNKKIIIDTREQAPLKITNSHEIDTLKFGDYKLKHDDEKLIIERKALNDFYSTLGFQLDRFEREIQRGVDEKYYMIVLIEAPLSEVYRFPFLPYIRNKMKLNPEIVLHNMRDLTQKYENLQFLFVKNRSEAQEAIKKVFGAGKQCAEVDLQLCYDQGGLI